ncbi:MAG TPA: Ig-like domain-containing protein, partial [Candidatus Acidoferrum sp.]|nr:Ig-like domain-containing protein [Candidatus Acidoferrum sp.]
MKRTSAGWLAARPVDRRLFHIIATVKDLRCQVALMAALALPGFPGLEAAALPNPTPPKVAISSPASGTRTNAGAAVTFRGTASDNVEVTNVSYWVTNLNGADSAPLLQGQAVLTAGSRSVSNWSASVVSPAAGSNIFVARSYDASGNPSAIATVKFFVKSPTPMALTTTGYGKVKGASYITGDPIPSTNGALLNVGEAYSVTATPAVNNYFSDWSGAALTAFGASNGLTLHFIMESNTSITANFITNRFVGMAGLYNGLFSSGEIGTNTEETSGMIGNLSLNARGTYSATVLLGGSGKGISGTFTPDGHATNTVLMTNGVPDG